MLGHGALQQARGVGYPDECLDEFTVNGVPGAGAPDGAAVSGLLAVIGRGRPRWGAPATAGGVALRQGDATRCRWFPSGGVQAGARGVGVAEGLGGLQPAQGIYHADGAQVVEAGVIVGEQGVLPAGGEAAVQAPGVLRPGRGAEHRSCGQAKAAEQGRQGELFGDVPDNQGGPQALAGSPHGDQCHQRALAGPHHADEVEQSVERQGGGRQEGKAIGRHRVQAHVLQPLGPGAGPESLSFLGFVHPAGGLSQFGQRHLQRAARRTGDVTEVMPGRRTQA